MTTDCVYLYTAATVAINKNAVIGRAALNGLYCGLQVRLLEIGLPVSRTIRQITVTHDSDFIPARSVEVILGKWECVVRRDERCGLYFVNEQKTVWRSIVTSFVTVHFAQMLSDK